MFLGASRFAGFLVWFWLFFGVFERCLGFQGLGHRMLGVLEFQGFRA